MSDVQFFLKSLNEYSPAITAVTAIVVAFLTYFLASDNRRLRKAGTEPEVIAYLSPHPDGTGGVNFVVANVGQGPAFSITFQLSYDEDDFDKHQVRLRNDPQRTALTVLPQGEKIGSLFGVGYVLFGNHSGGDKIPLQPFKVRISYRDIRHRRHQSVHAIDITQFAGLQGLLAKPVAREVADTLKKVERHLEKLARESAQITSLIDATKLAEEYTQKIKGQDPDT